MKLLDSAPFPSPTRPVCLGPSKGDVLAIVTLVAISVLFFWPILTRQVHFIGLSDTSDLIIPYEMEIAKFLSEGIFPLWAPHTFGGFPAAGHPQLGIFYPITLFFLWISGTLNVDIATVYQYNVILHVILMSIGVYCFGRTLRLRCFPSLIAAIACSYAPAFLMFVVWGNSLPGFSYWGFTLAALVLAQENEDRRSIYVVVAGLLLGLTILAAPSQPAIQLILLIAGLFVAQASPHLRDGKRLAHLFGRYLMVAAIGLSIGAIALLPVLEFANESVRFVGAEGGVPTNERMTFTAFTESALSFKNVGGFLVKELSRGGAGGNFIGAFPVLGIVLALVNYRNIRSPYLWYMAIMSLISILYAFNLWIPRLFYFIPGLDLIREPDRYCATFVFTISFLAAMGLQAALKSECMFIQRQLIAGLLFAILAGLMLALASRHLASDILAPHVLASAMALVWLALMALTHKITSLRSVMSLLFLLGMVWTTIHSIPYFQWSYRDYDPQADIASMRGMSSLKPNGPEPFRVFAMRDRAPTARGYNANAAGVAGFYDIFGFNNPIPLRSLRAFNSSFARRIYLDLLNVRYVVTEPQSVEQVNKVIGEDAEVTIRLPNLLVRDGNWQISRGDMVAIENTHRYGAAWLVDRYDVVDRPWTNRDEIYGGKDAKSLMWRTEASDFDAGKQAVVDRVPHLANGVPLTSWTGEPIAKAPVEWQDYGPNGFTMVVNASRDSLLIVSELWYPGWRATVNGQTTEIVRADWLLRAVAVPAGPAVVQFSYRPTSVILGVILFLFGFVLAVVALLPRSTIITMPGRLERHF